MRDNNNITMAMDESPRSSGRKKSKGSSSSPSKLPPLTSSTAEPSKKVAQQIPLDPFEQWVDYLPSDEPFFLQDDEERPSLLKRVSLDPTDPTESNVTNSSESQLEPMDTDDWPDSGSLEDYPIFPNALLVEQDPVLQQQLLLEDSDQSSVMSPTTHFAASLEELLEHRRVQLAAFMQASQKTRQCLEPHIKQRATLAKVLTEIEQSSRKLEELVLLVPPSSDASSSTGGGSTRPSSAATVPTPAETDVVVHDEDDEEALAASALVMEENDNLILSSPTN